MPPCFICLDRKLLTILVTIPIPPLSIELEMSWEEALSGMNWLVSRKMKNCLERFCGLEVSIATNTSLLNYCSALGNSKEKSMDGYFISWPSRCMYALTGVLVEARDSSVGITLESEVRAE